MTNRVAMLLVGLLCSGMASAGTPAIDHRIDYYREILAADQQHYPAAALLGAAYLDKARQTHDPILLQSARENLARSLEIQSNFEALKQFAALSNFAHRFHDALEWGRQARKTIPTDTSVTAILVEAHLGLGQHEQAERLLNEPGHYPRDFYLMTARAQVFMARGQFDRAASEFAHAVDVARRQNAPALAVWAEISAAGARIDSRRLELAGLHLDAAAQADPKNDYLLIRRGELLHVGGRLADALSTYQQLLQQSGNPVVDALAFEIALELGYCQVARAHFGAAEAGFLRAIDAGEVYTLGALARLYLAGDVRLVEAARYAKKNLKYKRDQEARNTFDGLQNLTVAAGAQVNCQK